MGLSNAAIHTCSSALQRVVTTEELAVNPSPSQSTPEERVITLTLLHLRFAYRVTGYGDLPPKWEAVVREKVNIKGLATLNQNVMRGLRPVAS